MHKVVHIPGPGVYGLHLHIFHHDQAYMANLVQQKMIERGMMETL